MQKRRFNRAIHTVGEQAVPVMFGLNDLSADEHILLCSERTRPVAVKLKDATMRNGIKTRVCVSDPTDMDQIVSDFINAEDLAGKTVAINKTGGTKQMADAAVLVAENKALSTDCFYYDTAKQRRFHWPTQNSERITESTSFENLNFKRITLDDFTRLFDYAVQAPAENYDELFKGRRNLAEKTWQFRRTISVCPSDSPFRQVGRQGTPKPTLQQEAAELWSRKQKRNFPVSIHNSCDNPKYNEYVAVHYDEGSGGIVAFANPNGVSKIPISSDFIDFPAYLGGKWFEEHVYLAINDLAASGRLLEARPNVSLVSNRIPNSNMREFDVLATDGVRLFIVECKAGGLCKEYVQDLDARVSQYAGSFGVGVLIAQRYQHNNNAEIQTIFESVENSRNVFCFHGDACVELLKEHMSDLRTPRAPKTPKGSEKRIFASDDL